MTDEQIQWTGHPSQWQNLGWFVLCLLLIPIPFAWWKWLETRNTVYIRLRSASPVSGRIRRANDC